MAFSLILINLKCLEGYCLFDLGCSPNCCFQDESLLKFCIVFLIIRSCTQFLLHHNNGFLVADFICYSRVCQSLYSRAPADGRGGRLWIGQVFRYSVKLVQERKFYLSFRKPASFTSLGFTEVEPVCTVYGGSHARHGCWTLVCENKTCSNRGCPLGIWKDYKGLFFFFPFLLLFSFPVNSEIQSLILELVPEGKATYGDSPVL